ncbi:CYTH and CHAD domain-containing protein [Rhizorhabdus dicambivorans]|uniref:Inorganic triphosphatase n=1 Tax=Rhizorhabdus dicambivorans TaxID=1850238 RepID=A0A2A4FVC1_9SPHN|nr:CYTH and CHAD domain-containing protein [Rhizorhabdus dicambivorans]ATE64565.1 inorganic triphosphatase [Rhizorhabdus dicambivorans]PCE41660.1 inorganic triphosphatase [Rhizorhabdus dicambivorans]
MDDPLEIELKLEFDPSDRERLLGCALLGVEGQSPKRLCATYFDTPDLKLDKAGYVLRIRKEGTRHVQTVKAASRQAAGLFVRGEWERKVGGGKPVLDDKAGPLTQLFDAATLEKIAPLFVTDVERLAGPIERKDGSLVEYAIDAGEVRAGARHQALSEIELELKQGSPETLFDLARTLNETVPLRLGVQSKSERGYALARNRSAAAVRAEPIRLDKGMTAGDGFAAITAACIRQYRLNEDLLLRSGGVEPLHQARVALRRLRSAFWLFRPLLEGDDKAAMFAAELRWLAGELGEIRDIDALLPRLEGVQRTSLAAMRESRFVHLCNQLQTGRARLLPIDLAEWLSIGPWRGETAGPGPRDRDLRGFAADRLERLRRRIKREGKGLADLADDHRHEVRKDAKKLRYAAEFFVSLYPGRKPRRRMDRFLDRLEALQDKLGELNDRAAAPALFARLGVDLALPPLGRKERKRLLEDAEDCFDALIDCKRFWRD